MKKRRPRMSSSRRRFLSGAGALGAVSTLEWLGFFRNHGVPGSPKDWGIAKARAQEAGEEEPRFLVYWFLEGGWSSYSMFSPVDTPNHSTLAYVEGELNPTPPWSDQFYRATGFEDDGAFTQTRNGIRCGYLAEPGADLFSDMAVLSSHRGSTFHSGSRFDYHYGRYSRSLSGQRGDDERSVLQAFCEAKGGGFLLPHVSWHRWLSDGELDPAQYPPGTGYFEQLGPPQAHTIYGRSPADLKARLSAIGDVTAGARRARIRQYTDNLHNNLVSSRDGQSVRSFASALEIHRALSDGELNVDLQTLFEDPQLKADFGVQPGDEIPSFRSVNGNPARSKESPHVRVQAMMAYELMRAGVSCGFWIESRDVRAFDDHAGRRGVLDRGTHPNQRQKMIDDLWDPLRAFVARLKSTPCPGLAEKTLWDQTTIVVASEMGRTIQGDVQAILDSGAPAAQQFQEIMGQDICQHWDVSSALFLGGNVEGGRQYGGVGSQTYDPIPIQLADGSFSPAYDPVTGLGNGGDGVVPDAGHIYSTALHLAGVDPTGKGRNDRPPLTFIQKP
jgi:hypothetical protein